MPILERERYIKPELPFVANGLDAKLEPKNEFSFARPGLAKLGGLSGLQAKAVAYEPQFDKREGLKASYLSKQIDTFIGERLNVLLSKNKYEIKNNLMFGEDMDEPFADVIRRGVDYRRIVEGEDRIDRKREEAEFEGFLKIQEVMSNPNTPLGTMMLSISPQGSEKSLYQHNFYDIFTLKEDPPAGGGRRFVEARRYSSALTVDEYKEKLRPLYDLNEDADDVYLLGHSVQINNNFFRNAEEIHAYLHKNHRFKELEKFQEIINGYLYRKAKQKYIETRDPIYLDAMMNIADRQAGLVKANKYVSLIGPNMELNMDRTIRDIGKETVRPVAAGCGPSSSVSQDSKSSPFSVSDFAETDKYGERKFECPECGKTNVRPKDELLKNCQHCNSSKVSC